MAQDNAFINLCVKLAEKKQNISLGDYTDDMIPLILNLLRLGSPKIIFSFEDAESEQIKRQIKNKLIIQMHADEYDSIRIDVSHDNTSISINNQKKRRVIISK